MLHSLLGEDVELTGPETLEMIKEEYLKEFIIKYLIMHIFYYILRYRYRGRVRHYFQTKRYSIIYQH